MFILIGSTVFSLAFQGVDGHDLGRAPADRPAGRPARLPDRRQHPDLLAGVLPRLLRAGVHRHAAAGAGGRQAGHRPDLVRRAAGGEHADLVHAPAVRLRAVLPAQRGAARATTTTASRSRPIAPVTTGQIYWGAVPFVIIQVIMVGLIIAFPSLVSSGLDKDADDRRRQGVPADAPGQPAAATAAATPGSRRLGCVGPAAGAPTSRRRHADAARVDQARTRRRSAERATRRRQRKTPPRRGFSLRASRRAQSFCALHEVVEARLGEAEPQVLRRARNVGVVVVDLLPVRVLGARARCTAPSPP